MRVVWALDRYCVKKDLAVTGRNRPVENPISIVSRRTHRVATGDVASRDKPEDSNDGPTKNEAVLHDHFNSQQITENGTVTKY